MSSEDYICFRDWLKFTNLGIKKRTCRRQASPLFDDVVLNMVFSRRFSFFPGLPAHPLQELHASQDLLDAPLGKRPDVSAQFVLFDARNLRNHHHALFG